MDNKLTEEIATGIAGMMDTQPNNLVGRDNPSKYEKQGKRREKKAQLNYKYMKIRNKKGKVMESLNEAVEILEFLLGEMASEEVSEVLETRISEELKEELSERIQEIIEGRLWNEEQRRPTKEAGRLASKYKTVQKAIRRNAEKNIQRAEKEEKEADKEQKELENKYVVARQKSSDLRDKALSAGDIFDATYKKYGAGHEATRQAYDNSTKAVNKHVSAIKKADKISDKVNQAGKKKLAASNKYYDNYKRSNRASDRIHGLNGIEFRSTFSDK